MKPSVAVHAFLAQSGHVTYFLDTRSRLGVGSLLASLSSGIAGPMRARLLAHSVVRPAGDLRMVSYLGALSHVPYLSALSHVPSSPRRWKVSTTA